MSTHRLLPLHSNLFLFPFSFRDFSGTSLVLELVYLWVLQLSAPHPRVSFLRAVLTVGVSSQPF